MRKILLSLILIVILFMIEFVVFNLIGRVFVPNLLLALIVFITLAFGIRHGLLCAICAGFLKDSFSSYVFGINVFTFVVCSFAVVVLRKRFYHSGSKPSRLLLVFLVLCVEQFTQIFIHLMFGSVPVSQIFLSIFIPEAIMTLLITTYLFKQLKICALKLSVL